MCQNNFSFIFHDSNLPLVTARLLRELLLQARLPQARAALQRAQEDRP